MSTQMNWGPSHPHETASKEAVVDHAQSNWDGGRTTKKGGQNKSKWQINFDVTMENPTMEDPGQGQKAGTGSQGGY